MTDKLFSLQDEVYRTFQIRLLPNLNPDAIIGVRTPELRKIARSTDPEYLNDLPHRYFEENQIHAFMLETIPDFEKTVNLVDVFLPFVDNWATCDQLRPKVFAKEKHRLLPYILRWLQSDHPYTVRFALEMLMVHFLESDFIPEYLSLAAEVKSDHYYVRMMVAWFFATALTRQYDSAFSYIAQYRLSRWIHNKAIQKATESRCIPEGRKKALVQYRIH